MRLVPQLVPATAFYRNMRSAFPKEWERVRHLTYRKHNFLCCICGGRGEEHPVEAHEVWSFDDTTKVQRLATVIAVCPPCHHVIHFGLSCVRGNREEALQHMMRVNAITREEANRVVAEAYHTWHYRSHFRWILDEDSIREVLHEGREKGW